MVMRLEHLRHGWIRLLAVDDQAPGLARPAARETRGRRLELRHQERGHHIGRIGQEIELEADAVAAGMPALTAAAAPYFTANDADRSQRFHHLDRGIAEVC